MSLTACVPAKHTYLHFVEFYICLLNPEGNVCEVTTTTYLTVSFNWSMQQKPYTSSVKKINISLYICQYLLRF